MPFEPARLVDAGDHERIELFGLSLAGLRQLLIDAHGLDLHRPELARLHQRTGGNPLHALELARLFADGHSIDSAALPPSLRATLGARVSSLPADTLRVLQTAALLADPRVAKIQQVLPGIDVVEALAPAERERVATVRDASRIERGRARVDIVVFDHPLHAAAAVDSMTTAERRSLHVAIADISDDDVERALHLGASRGEPDEHTAALLEAGGERALERGSPDVSVELFRSSVDLTPGGAESAPARHRRLYALADALTTAGDHGDALTALTEIQASSCDPDLLARALSLRVVAASNVEGPAAAFEAAEAALAAATDPDERALQLMRITRLEQFNDLRRGVLAAERALSRGAGHTCGRRSRSCSREPGSPPANPPTSSSRSALAGECTGTLVVPERTAGPRRAARLVGPSDGRRARRRVRSRRASSSVTATTNPTTSTSSGRRSSFVASGTRPNERSAVPSISRSTRTMPTRTPASRTSWPRPGGPRRRSN